MTQLASNYSESINTNAFEMAVLEALSTNRDDFNYSNLVNNHLDINRFYPWVEQVNAYKPVAGASVFSSGCGSGGDLMAFAENGAAKLTGIEVDSSLASLANKRFENSLYANRFEVATYAGDILPYPPESFDIVLSMHVIEHTKNVGQYLSELFRVINFGGILFLDVPNRYFWQEQHTLLPYIHFLPVSVRNLLIRMASHFLCRLPDKKDLNYKLLSLTDFHIPTPARIMKQLNSSKSHYGLKTLDAFFHSYSKDRMQFTPKSGYFDVVRRFTTFRLVVQKCHAPDSQE